MGEETTRDRLSLRAHHLLCLHGFQGLGYDDRFVENMGEICARVRAEPGPEIVVVNEPDDICAPCPHALGGACGKTESDAEEKAKQLDHRVLAKLGLHPGQVFSRDALLALIQEKITPEDLVSVCEGCEWLPFDYCAEGLRRNRLGSD